MTQAETGSPAGLWRRARFAVLLAPALLGGCYVVPIVPVQRPIYREHPGHHQHRHRHHHYRIGEVQPPANAGQAVADRPSVHIEVASNSR